MDINPTINHDGTPRKLKNLIHEPLAQDVGGIQCITCKDFLSVDSFYVFRPSMILRRNWCRLCDRTYRKEQEAGLHRASLRSYSMDPAVVRKRYTRQKADPRTAMLMNARRRGKIFSVPCTITVDDIVIPKRCPVFGFPLTRNLVGKKSAVFNSASLDRIIPKLGYIPGNVHVISHKANSMKSSRSPAEWEAFARWILGLIENGGLYDEVGGCEDGFGTDRLDRLSSSERESNTKQHDHQDHRGS